MDKIKTRKKAMQTLTPDLPTNEKKRQVTSEVNLELYEAILAEIARRHSQNPKEPKIKIRQVLEWGMKAYLLAANPETAAALGIQPGDHGNVK